MNQERAAFFAGIAKKRMGAGVLLFDEADRLLVVEPTYKATWEIPGGAVERDESPRAAVIREVREELGLELAPERLTLAGLNYMAAGGEKTEALMFVFVGGVLSPAEQRAIRVPPEELRSFRFVPPTEAFALLGPVLAPRVRRCLEAGSFVYTEGRYGDV